MITNGITRDAIKGSFWSMEIQEVLAWLKTSSNGLNEEEVAVRLRVFGPNTIRERRRFSKIKIIGRQIRSPLIFILIIAGIINVFLAEWVGAGVILAAVAVNTLVGFWQENKAENVLELLKTYIRTRAIVRRNGKEREVDASELVPGDIIRVRQGDRIPADARLVYVNNAEVDESALTGEALPVEKNTDRLPQAASLGDRKSMVYTGTLMVQGFADAVVIGIGENTEFGRISALVSEKEEPTPLQLAIRKFAGYVGIIIAIFTLALFLLGIFEGQSFYNMFLVAVAVAVSAIPEGLPITLTVILAVGVQRLARRKGIARQLLAAETLGSTSMILTDKTGTLTQAKMELAEILPHGEATPDNLLRNALLNTNLIIENPGDAYEKWIMSGRALEISMAKGAAARGILLPKILDKVRIIDQLPFSSEKKFSAILFDDDKGTHLSIFGAPEIVLGFTELHDQEREKLATNIREMAFAGQRVLGIASRNVTADEKDLLAAKVFSGLSFDGLIGFRDPLRPQVADAIREIAAAGVKTVIVTGDHPGTAESVARELGMIDGTGTVLTGDDLTHMDHDELLRRSENVAVYARVTPEQKVLIAKLYQEKGEVVSVTGDGVNDAPALRVADVGVAVGSGTDVAKSASDLIILDDNFETIVTAIKEGRRVLQNIRKVIIYLLSDAFDELFLIGGALIAGLTLPISALQILFVNLFADSFPAISFAFEDGIDGTKTHPSKIGRGIFDREIKFFILAIGSVSSVLLFLFYIFLLRAGFEPILVRTFIFASFASYTLFLSLSLRSLEKNIFRYNPFSNRYLTASVGLGLLLVVLAVYLPWFQNIFGTVSLPPVWLFGVAIFGVVNIILIELGKKFFHRLYKKH